MNISYAVKFALWRAREEVGDSAVHAEELPEHVLLGLFKLAELSEEETRKMNAPPEMNGEIKKLKQAMLNFEITPSTVIRQSLRSVTEAEDYGDGIGKEELLMKASLKSKGRAVTATDVFDALIDEPTHIIKTLFNLGGERAESDRNQPAAYGTPVSLDKLPGLTDTITKLRFGLLGKVRGQDHAVHAVADGIFGAEILTDADENRNRPKAIFVFAGPPGVGKTFLAQQTAEILDIPFKIFDMSGYSDHQAQLNLIGFNRSYRNSVPGTLTTFVDENPRCILLFDEIEKAHINTIHIFLQLLDAGRLHDDFYEKNGSFNEAIVIFTTNAGRQLYADRNKASGEDIPKQAVLNALETEINPVTKGPFFPAAICSRIATGYPVMFNNLQVHDLMDIITDKLKQTGKRLERLYGLKTEWDDYTVPTILFAEGGFSDARTLSAQAEAFVKKQVQKICGDGRIAKSFFDSQIDTIRFEVALAQLPDDIRQLYKNPYPAEVLFFGDPWEMLDAVTDCRVHCADNLEKAAEIAAKQDILFVLYEPKSVDIGEIRGTLEYFKERMPGIPIYLAESESSEIDDDLWAELVRRGVRGKISRVPETDDAKTTHIFSRFIEKFTKICSDLYMQNVVTGLASQRKVLFYETARTFCAEQRTVKVALSELSLRRNIRAADSGSLLDDAEKPKEKFCDVIGAKDAKKELMFFVDFLKNPKKFTAEGKTPPKGVLLHGPPGTGKTMLAKALAGESGVTYIATTANDLTKGSHVGDETKAVRELFECARQYAPSVVFIDEIDVVGRDRGAVKTGHSGYTEGKALNALLTEMDGFSTDPKRVVFVLAATNFDVDGGVLDAAMLRRFSRTIYVDLPNKDERKEYLEAELAKIPGHAVTPEMIALLADRTTMESLATLKKVVERALNTAAEKGVALDFALLDDAFELIKFGDKNDRWSDYLEQVAWHEAGHAYMHWISGSTPSYVTIVARKNYGGYMQTDDETVTAPIRTRESLLKGMRISLAGRAAELVRFGEEGMTTGASADLENATRIARNMVCAYGMDSSIGLAAIPFDDAKAGPFGEKIAARIAEIMDGEMKAAVNAITEGRDKVERLVKDLLDKNRLTKDEIEKILV